MFTSKVEVAQNLIKDTRNWRLVVYHIGIEEIGCTLQHNSTSKARSYNWRTQGSLMLPIEESFLFHEKVVIVGASCHHQ
jgi:chorismate-pyruvate lyase